MQLNEEVINSQLMGFVRSSAEEAFSNQMKAETEKPH